MTGTLEVEDSELSFLVDGVNYLIRESQNKIDLYNYLIGEEEDESEIARIRAELEGFAKANNDLERLKKKLLSVEVNEF